MRKASSAGANLSHIVSARRVDSSQPFATLPKRSRPARPQQRLPMPDGRGLPQAPPVERYQSLPVPLRSRLVVAPALREGETVIDAGVQFNLTGGAGPP